MLVVGRVLLALVAAGSASHRARLDHRADDAEIGLGLPDDDSSGGIAGIGAVEAEASAADHLAYVRFAASRAAASLAEASAILEFLWYSMSMSALELCFGPGGMP